MKPLKKFVPFLLPSLLLVLLAGCQLFQGAFVSREQEPVQTPRGASDPKKFQEPNSQGRLSTDSAVDLSEKYALLSDELAALRAKNQDLLSENTNLKENLASCNAQLQQSQKELTQANDLLIEMRLELNNWKTDVLGYRDEMRLAQKAQLESLIKILQLLGGEVAEEANQTPAKSASSVAEQNQTQTDQNSPSGETNE
jgi:chromosome segregation ATPase